MPDSLNPGDAYERLTDAYKEHFGIEDTAPLDVCLAAVVTSHFPETDPLWAFLVGPPSSGKTEIIRIFEEMKDRVVALSSMSPNSLVSGLRDGKDLLPLLDGKVLMVKDFTTILEMSREARDQLFAVLRDAFDGHYSKSFGTVGTKGYASHFNHIAGVTNSIEEYYSAQSVLGQRYLMVRTKFPDIFDDPDDAELKRRREKLRYLAQDLVRSCADGMRDPPPISDAYRNEIKTLARDVAVLRTHVHRESGSHDVNAIPEAEKPARLTNQLKKLATGIAIAMQHSDVSEDEMSVVRAVARGTVLSIRTAIIDALHRGTSTVDGTAMDLRLNRRTVERKIEDLVMLGAVNEDASGKPYLYHLSRPFPFILKGSKELLLTPTSGEIMHSHILTPDVRVITDTSEYLKKKANEIEKVTVDMTFSEDELVKEFPEDVHLTPEVIHKVVERWKTNGDISEPKYGRYKLI